MPAMSKAHLSSIPVDRLLEGSAYVRYRTEVDLLGLDGASRRARDARTEIASAPEVKRLMVRRGRAGYWGRADEIFKWWPKKDTSFWVLGVLADFGLRRDDLGIADACEYVLSTQLPCGGFGLRAPPKAYDCFTGILVSARSPRCVSYPPCRSIGTCERAT